MFFHHPDALTAITALANGVLDDLLTADRLRDLRTHAHAEAEREVTHG